MKTKWLALIVIVALAAIGDAQIPTADRPSTRIALAGIHLYQATLSPFYTRIGVQCRFTPTCSHYAEATVREWGAWRGGWLAARRVLRCGPWTPAGTVDPPPHPSALRQLPRAPRATPRSAATAPGFPGPVRTADAHPR